MSFATGSVSFRRFAVVGESPAGIDQALLDKLAEHILEPGEFGVPQEIEYGWSGGRHILDNVFSFEHNVFADCLHVALRTDTNKVPGDLKKAYTLIEQEAAAAENPSGFISKAQKKQAKESVQNKLDDEMRTGRFRKTRLAPLLWDVPAAMLYCVASNKTQEQLLELFERTFGLALQPLSAGSLALRLLEPIGKRRDYEDFRPTRFVAGPAGESQHPEYPWVAKGPEPKDFLGNEFLLWLWHAAEAKDGAITTDSAGEVSILIDKSLDLDCAYGETGRDSLRGDGPARMPEARDGLRSGKVPRRAGLILEAHRQSFTLGLNPEAMAVASAILPEVEEAESPRELFEERITFLRDLNKILDGLFATFLKVRAGSSWEGQVSTIRKWIMQTSKQPVAVG